MPDETGESSPNPFTIDPEGDYGTLDPRFLAQNQADLEALRTEYLSGDSEEAAATRLVDVRKDIAKSIGRGRFEQFEGMELDDEDGLMLSMALDLEIDQDLEGEAYTNQLKVPADAPPEEQQLKDLKNNPKFKTLAETIERDRRSPLFIRWKINQAWEWAQAADYQETN